MRYAHVLSPVAVRMLGDYYQLGIIILKAPAASSYVLHFLYHIHQVPGIIMTSDKTAPSYRICPIKRTLWVQVGNFFCSRGFVKHTYNRIPNEPIAPIVPIAVLRTATRNGR